ncbi:hypothetical protein MATL_G00006550 [Megalops atlanticus]|uniref:Uncharacterized protein n=1 Tax=Megalops atlanticus TaxID=7932 RepID=A0A9D3QKR1_MEGAT|nr:hypothetical protein MATL_G00006550 [Megalops atlanticus]
MFKQTNMQRLDCTPFCLFFHFRTSCWAVEDAVEEGRYGVGVGGGAIPSSSTKQYMVGQGQLQYSGVKCGCTGRGGLWNR